MTEQPKYDAELAAERDELAAEVHRLQGKLDERDRQLAVAARGAIGWGGRVLLGRRLRSSFRAWLEAKSLRDPFPADETADVLAALVGRFVRVGVWGALIAVAPGLLTVGFLLKQNSLVQDQITEQRRQTNEQVRQINQQAADTLIVRRAQLLATIYECGPAGAAEGERPPERQADVDAAWRPIGDCRPRASGRARAEAVIAFCEIERGRGVRPDLKRANLAGLPLNGANLARADLNKALLAGADLGNAVLADADLGGANLTGTVLSGADLTHAFIVGADLTDANLAFASLTDASLAGTKLAGASVFRANLTGADLNLADLSLAILTDADLTGANLTDATLNGANLTGATLTDTIVTKEQIREADGDAATVLPAGMVRPDRWTSDG